MSDTAGNEPVLELDGITRTFKQGKRVLEVLRGADLRVGAGEVVALVGPSGADTEVLSLIHI